MHSSARFSTVCVEFHDFRFGSGAQCDKHWRRLGFASVMMFSLVARLPRACQRAPSFAATVRPKPLGRPARPCDRSAYAYTPSGRSPAHAAATGFGVLGWRRRNLPPMAPRVFVAPATGLGLAPAPRAAAPVAFAAFRVAMLRRLNTTSSPRGVLRRACGEPRRRVSLSSALDPSRRFLRFR